MTDFKLSSKVLLSTITYIFILFDCPLAKADWNIETIYNSLGQEASIFVGPIALDSGDNPHIIFYDYEMSYLNYAYRDDTGWHIEMVAHYDEYKGGGVSIALDSNDNPHICYARPSTWQFNKLYYTYYDTEWHTEELDEPAAKYFCSISLDSNDNPHLSYDAGNFYRYAYHDGTSWQKEYVTNMDELGHMGYYISITLDSNDSPHISYQYYEQSNSDIKYAHYNNGWQVETVDNNGDLGRCSITLDSNDNPYISYFDSTADELKYAYHDSTGWHIVKGFFRFADSEGFLALDNNDSPHIIYNRYKDHYGYLTYAYYDGTSWQKKTVDSGERRHFRRTSIAFDSNDNFHIIYVDSISTSSLLKYAILVKQTTTTSLNGSTTTITVNSSTSSISSMLCGAKEIYGENSEEVELMRYIRDNILTQTPEGKELIRLYYQWSPAIVKAMEEDGEFEEEVKEMIDGVLELIGGKGRPTIK